MKTFKFQAKEGTTPDCTECPFSRMVLEDYGEDMECANMLKGIFDCEKFNLNTLKYIEEDEAN